MVKEELKWCEITLSDVVKNGNRLEASVFDIDVQRALKDIESSSFPSRPLIGANGFVQNAHYGDRLKRNYVPKIAKGAIGFLGSAEMLDFQPRPQKFMLNDERVEKLRVKEGMLLISRSGTIGNMAYVNHTLSKYLVSEHAIRLECKEYPGYVYAFLKTETGQNLIQSKNFGSVVQEIEPDDIASIPVPDANDSLKKQIDLLVKKAYELRDEANTLIDEAMVLLQESLKLPEVEDFDENDVLKLNSFDVKLSELNNRFDASYHVPLVREIERVIKEQAKEVIPLGDKRLSKEIILPGRFKRVYVEKGHGTTFIGGKQLWQIDPTNKKYLSNIKHGDLISNKLELHNLMTLITCSGTIGKVAMVGKHWEGWAANQHIIRVVPASDEVAGYINLFLSTECGRQLIIRHTYGAVIDEIDDTHVAEIPIPIISDKKLIKKINDNVLQANELRYKSYIMEMDAIEKMNNEVIFT